MVRNWLNAYSLMWKLLPVDAMQERSCWSVWLSRSTCIRGTEYGIAPEERQRLETDSMNVARQYLDKVMGQLKNKGIAVKAEVLFGKADEKLIELAKSDVDLIIIASHGRSGISRWVWGSVADRILRGACLPVMMIRAPGCYPGI